MEIDRLTVIGFEYRAVGVNTPDRCNAERGLY